MKWLMILRIVVIFWPVVQKLFGQNTKAIKNKAINVGLQNAAHLFPAFEKVKKKIGQKDIDAIIELARLINEAYPDEDPNKDKFHNNER